MNWGQFKDPLCYLYLHGTVVSSLSLMHEVVGSRLTFYKNFVNEFTEFSESHKGNIRNLCTGRQPIVNRVVVQKATDWSKFCKKV